MTPIQVDPTTYRALGSFMPPAMMEQVQALKDLPVGRLHLEAPGEGLRMGAVRAILMERAGVVWHDTHQKYPGAKVAPVKPVQDTPRGLRSALAYARRYPLLPKEML